MADSAVVITSGTGTNIDTRTESTNGNHRQVVTIGDPSTNAGVAPVDGTAGLKVDLGADNDVTVTGTVTAELSATDNAVLDNIDADLTTIIGHVDGAEGLLTTIDADTSNISTKIDTIAGDTTSIQTAVELLDDTVATDGSATPTKGILMAGQDGTNAQTVKTDSDGNLQVDVLTMPTTTVTGTVAVTNAGITTIAGAVSGTEMQVDVITMPTTTVQATNLDIRDLSSASDSVTIHGDVGAIDQLDLTNSNPVTVALVDGDGTHITSIGGGTQYTEGDTDASITGTAMLWEDTSDTLRAVSASKPLPVGIVSSGITGIAHGVRTVTTAGTDVALASSTTCKRVTIQAQTDNTGLIAVGASGVDATEATGTGIILYAGDAIELDIDDLADVYIDSTVSGEGVRYTYLT